MKNSQMALRIPNPEDFVDVSQAVKITGLSRSTIYQMVREGRLKGHTIGAHTVFWRDDVAELARAVQLVRGERRP
jgi:excisionase family DNA binding protein